MPKLLIIGNGFDLNLQVPSRFEDYFNSVLNNNSEIKIIIERIKSYKLLSRSSDEKAYFDNFNRLKVDFNELYKYSDVNLWFLYLYFNLNYNYDQNWSDIELVLNSFLNGSDLVDKLSSTIRRLVFRERYENSYLTDLEIYSYLLIFKYIELNNSGFNIFEILMKELNYFEISFSKYLNYIIKGKEYYKEAGSLFNKLVNSKDEFNVLNFNYTNPEKYNKNSKLKRIENVHGSLKNRNIIIGIDYSNVKFDTQHQIGAFSFTKTSRKIHNTNEHSNDISDPLLEKNVDEVIIFGHSLSMADYSYYQSIFDYYDLYHSNIKLRFKYSIYNSNIKNKIKLEQSNRVIKLILDYGTTMDNKDNGKNLLHKLLLENRLHIELIK